MEDLNFDDITSTTPNQNQSNNYSNSRNDENRPNLSGDELKEFIQFIIERLVSDKEAVEVVVSEEMPGSKTVHIKVAQEDKGRVIGKSGNTINSIRSLVRVFGRIMVLVQE